MEGMCAYVKIRLVCVFLKVIYGVIDLEGLDARPWGQGGELPHVEWTMLCDISCCVCVLNVVWGN